MLTEVRSWTKEANKVEGVHTSCHSKQFLLSIKAVDSSQDCLDIYFGLKLCGMVSN